MEFTKQFKDAMMIGHLFMNRYYNDERTEDWTGSEECSTFTRVILDYASENNVSVEDAYEYADSIIDEINSEVIHIEDHMWDDICKGFLAGEIIGVPSAENLELVRKANELWNNTDYGYYQEVLNEVMAQ